MLFLMLPVMRVLGMGTMPPAAPGPHTDLSAFVGKHPYDVVNGYRFFDHPAVKAAITRAVPNARMRAHIRVEDGAVN